MPGSRLHELLRSIAQCAGSEPCPIESLPQPLQQASLLGEAEATGLVELVCHYNSQIGVLDQDRKIAYFPAGSSWVPRSRMGLRGPLADALGISTKRPPRDRLHVRLTRRGSELLSSGVPQALPRTEKEAEPIDQAPQIGKPDDVPINMAAQLSTCLVAVNDATGLLDGMLREVREYFQRPHPKRRPGSPPVPPAWGTVLIKRQTLDEAGSGQFMVSRKEWEPLRRGLEDSYAAWHDALDAARSSTVALRDGREQYRPLLPEAWFLELLSDLRELQSVRDRETYGRTGSALWSNEVEPLPKHADDLLQRIGRARLQLLDVITAPELNPIHPDELGQTQAMEAIAETKSPASLPPVPPPSTPGSPALVVELITALLNVIVRSNAMAAQADDFKREFPQGRPFRRMPEAWEQYAAHVKAAELAAGRKWTTAKQRAARQEHAGAIELIRSWREASGQLKADYQEWRKAVDLAITLTPSVTTHLQGLVQAPAAWVTSLRQELMLIRGTSNLINTRTWRWPIKEQAEPLGKVESCMRFLQAALAGATPDPASSLLAQSPAPSARTRLVPACEPKTLTRPVSLSAASRWFGYDVRKLRYSVESGALAAKRVSDKLWHFDLMQLSEVNPKAVPDARPKPPSRARDRAGSRTIKRDRT